MIQLMKHLVTVTIRQLIHRAKHRSAYMTTVVFASFSLTSPEETKKSLTLVL
jgi:hypothetical protein